MAKEKDLEKTTHNSLCTICGYLKCFDRISYFSTIQNYFSSFSDENNKISCHTEIQK